MSRLFSLLASSLPGSAGPAPPIIRFAVSVILLSALAILLAYFVMLRMRYRTYRLHKKCARLNAIIDAHLMEHVLTMEETEETGGVISPDHIHAALRKPPFHRRSGKQVLVDRLIAYKKNIAGRMGDGISELFLLLDLDKFSIRKLGARSSVKVIQGLNEVTEMQIPVSDTLLLPLTNSRNRDVRAAARRAYIKLSNNEPFKFFDIATEHLLVWDQVELFSVISSTKGLAIPNFARWITYSSNKGVVSFCLKLIVHFNQLSAVQSVISLLNTKDHELRSEAINTLGKLKVEEVEDKLIGIYESQPRACQVEILKALGRISSGRHLDFLQQEFMHSTSFDIRKHAAKSLISNEWKAEEMIENLLNTVNDESRLILRHCMNPLIKF
jgi:HEAT repeat protein